MKVYLAGPDVFLPDAIEIGRRKVELCTRHGLTGLYPLDNAVNLAASDASLQIFRGNEAMMIEADAIIANLTPFRRRGRRNRLRTRLYGGPRQALSRLLQRSGALCRSRA
jgi:nucleoside 2-deoxyribosyltransferase